MQIIHHVRDSVVGSRDDGDFRNSYEITERGRKVFFRRDDINYMFVGHINMANCERLFQITCGFCFMIQRFCSLSGGDKCVVELIVFGLKCAVVDFLMRCRSAGTYA